MNVIDKIDNNYFTKNALTEESWKYIIGLLTKSVNEEKEQWLNFFRKQLKTFLCYKYFTRKKSYLKDISVQSELKLKLKEYYTSLISASDSLDFLNKINRLPNEIIFLILRQCFDISPSLKKHVIISREEILEEVKNLKKLRKKSAREISDVSLHYESVLDISLILKLYNNGLLFENNFINQGMCEFIVKLLDNEYSVKHLVDSGIVSKAEIFGLRDNITSFPSYNAYLRLKRQKECFSKEGEQVGNRFSDYIDMLDEPMSSDFIVDIKSVFKEPYAMLLDNMTSETPIFDNESGESVSNTGGIGATANGGESGSTFSNTADIDVPEIDMPSGETINNDTNETPTELPDEFGQETTEEPTEDENE